MFNAFTSLQGGGHGNFDADFFVPKDSLGIKTWCIVFDNYIVSKVQYKIYTPVDIPLISYVHAFQ